MPTMAIGAVAVTLGVLAQHTKPSRNKCSATYIGEDEIEQYFKRSPADSVSDRQVGVVDVGRSDVDINPAGGPKPALCSGGNPGR
jgi:hypothetical protein